MKIQDLTTATNLDRGMLIPISLLGQDMKISLGQILQMIEDGIILPPSLKAQYSADGTAWHTGMKSSDEWIRISDDGGATWGDAMPLRGKDGQEGLRNYTWIKFADDGDGTGMSDSPKGKTWLGIAYNKDTEEESDDPADYKWIPVKGDAGRSVRNVVRYYGVSLKTTIEPKKYVAVPPGKIPVMTAFTPVLWKYETTYFSDGTEESTEPGVVSVRGDKGDSPEVKWIGTKLQVNGLAPVDLKGEKMQFSDLTEDERLSIRGTDGDSAFESWKKLHPGSSSTLSEWLDSLNGKDGKDGENGKDGADGKDGLSAYEIHKKINPLSTLSEADWVASLKGEKFQYSDFTADELESLRGPQGIQGNIGPRGPQGNTGPQGDTGPQGETGPKGEDGATPEIDPDTKEWKIKGKLSGILAQGKDGHSPVVAINSAHHLTVDGVAVGDSLKGADGASITAEWNGKKLVIKNNGTALPEVDLQGAPGVDGKTPEIDPTTKKWKIGDTLTNIRAEGLSAYEVYKKTHTSSSLSEAQWLASLKGDKGDRGEQGLQGIKGDTGDTGAKGDKGDRGLQGLQGLSAYEVYKKNNTASTLTEAQWVSSLKGDKGDRGLKGDKGDKGEQGIQGVKGDTGLSAYELFKRNNASSTLTESQWVSSLKGANGDKGDQGIQGLQGVKGDKGDTGAKGDKGDKGDQGIQGLRGIQGLSAYDVFKKNNAASTLTEAQWVASLKGDKGERGLQGLKGDTGDKGDKGDKGEQGTPGVDGKTWKPTVAADGILSWVQSTSTTAPTSVNIKGADGKTFRPVYDPVTKKMTFSASSDTSAVTIDNIATVEMVEKLQLVSDKDGNFKVIGSDKVATTDTALKVSDFTDKKVFESSISNVNGKFEAYLTKSSAASLFVQKGELIQDLNIAAFTSDGLYYAATDDIAMTLKNSPFAQSFMMLTHTCYNSGDDTRRARLAVDAFGGIKVFDDRSTAGTAGTWRTVMTDKNTKITNGTITINGTSITPLVQHQSLANYVTTNTSQRISGGKTFNNGALAVRQDKACGLIFYSFGDSDTERVAAIEILGASGSWLKNSLDFYKSGRIVARNSFTATSIIKSGGTVSQFLMADGSVATKHTLSSVTNLGWGGTSGQVVTINTLAYWNGQYAAGGSNLMYCDRGRFGTMATMDAADYPTVERFNSGVVFTAGKFPDGGVQFNVMHDEDEPGVGNIVNIPTKTSHLTNDSGFLTSHQSLANRLWAQGSTDFDPATMDGYYVGMTTKSGITTNWWHLLSMNWGTGNTINNKTWASQLALPTEGRNGVYYRSAYSSSAYSSWVKLLDANNYSSILDGRYYTEAEADAKYLTALRVTGDALTWVKNGLGNNITLPFAAESKTLRSQGMLTAVTEKTLHGAGVKLYEAYNNGYPATYGNVLAVQGSAHMGAGELLLGWSGTDGGHASLYYRNHRDNTSTANWSAWATILDSVNFNSVIGSNLTAYVKKAGDTMTGTLTIGINAPSALAVFNQTGTNEPFIYLQRAGVYKAAFTHHSTHGTAIYNTPSQKYLGIKDDGTPHYNGNVLLHAGNYAATLDPRYVNVSGDTMTGDLLFSDSGTATRQVRFICGSNDYGRIAAGATATNAGWMEIASADDGNEPIYARQYSGAFASVVRTATLLDASGNTAFPGRVNASYFTANATTLCTNLNADLLDGYQGTSYAYGGRIGNFMAGSARANITTAQFITKLTALGAFARAQWSGKCSWSYASNDIITDTGLGNIQLAGAVIEVISNSTSEYTIRVTTSTTSTDGAATNAVFIYRNHGSGYAPNWKRLANTSDNVASATKLQTARKIFGVNFDGTGNVDGTLRIQANESNYCEGIRIKPTAGKWTTIVLGGSDLTANNGTSAKSWSIHNNDGKFYINMNGAGEAKNARAMATSTGWTFGNTSRNTYALNAASFICDSWVRTVGNTGWYSETYGGGWCMQDSTWIRIHGGKSLYAASGIIRTDGELQVGGGGDKFRVTAAGAVTATSFTKRGGTAAQALMADGSVRRVITFDDLTDDGNISVSDFDATLANGLVSVSALTEWDGRVHRAKANQSSQTGTTEIYNCNLQYCALGKLGDVVTHSHSEYLLAANLLKKTSVGDIGWGTAANQQKPLAMSAIAFWNGAYQGTSSNLAYCNKGAFGTMATKNADDYVTRTTAQTISGVKTFSGEQRFAATGLSYTDPWSGIGCAIKVTGKVGVTDSIKALSFIKAGGTFTQVLMADGNVRAVWLTKAAAISESGMAVTFNNTDGGDSEQMVDGFGLSAWNGASITAAGVRQSRLAYCVKGAFGDIVTHNASEFLTSGSLSGYVTKNTAQEISGAKTFTASMTARAITPQTSGTYNLGSTTSHWNHVFCRRLYVTSGASDSLTAAGLGTAVGLGWLELRSAGTPYIDFTGSNSTADYNVRLAYQNSQLEVNGANFSVANTIRSKAYIGMIFDYIGSTAKANTYGVMFYKRDTYFNIIRTKKGAPDTPTSDHGGSLMEINLATNAVTFAGVVTASNISTSSDARLKTRIADISLPIAKIAAAPLWRYRRKDTGVMDVGSTAQYWGAILPELTRTDEQGWMSLDYGKTALLASVSLARKADDHEARIKALEAENARLREKIARLEAA